MKTIRLTLTEDINRFLAAGMKLQAGNQASRDGAKLVDSAKAFIQQWLADNREIDLKALRIGETVIIQGVGAVGTHTDILKISVRGQERLDGRALEMEAPDVKAQFTRLFPTLFFENLIPAA